MPFNGYAAPLSKSSVSLRLFTCLWHQQHKYVGRKKSTWKAPQKTTTTARNFLLDPARIFITHSIFINFILLTHTTSYSQEILKFKIAMKLPQTRTHIFIFGRAKKAHGKYSAIDWKQIFYMFFSKWNAVWIYLEFQNNILYIDANPSKSCLWNGIRYASSRTWQKNTNAMHVESVQLYTVHCSNTRNDSNSSMLYVKREAIIYFVFFCGK